MKCPCESNNLYKECCGFFHGGLGLPSTAELLMRSRYSAFALGQKDYLFHTWHESKRPKSIELDSRHLKWTGLRILNKDKGSQSDSFGTVEFVARYSIGSKSGHLHEVSNFLKEDLKWFYIDGKIIND